MGDYNLAAYSEDALPESIGPEGASIANTYLANACSLSESSHALNLPTHQISAVLQQPLVKAYVNGILRENGYRHMVVIAQKLDDLVERKWEELEEAELYDKVWQAYAAVGDDKAVGVVGDERKYGNVVMIRVVDSIDAMTADWTRLPHGLLEKISNRITNEIEDVTWVTYVVSSKPPATIEPQ